MKRSWSTWVGIALCALGLWRMQQRPAEAMREGVAAYAEGSFEIAVERFREASEQSEALRIQRNLALAALASDRLELAVNAADRLAQGGAEDVAWRQFLYGNIGWRRSEQAETEAHGPVPPAGALERAIAYTEQARDAWTSVVDGDDPRELEDAAGRNILLAEQRLNRLRRELEDGSQTSDTEKVDDQQPQMQPMDEQQKQDLMDQIERLDRQEMERRLEDMPEQGRGLDW
ncbi:MAG: hypothetical protein ACPG31_13580 [Planctomycetota bacterium]